MGTRQVIRMRDATAGEPLSVAERACLMWMALHALDGKGRNPEDPPGIYWGGHAQLALEVYGVITPATKRLISRHIRNLELAKMVAVYDPNPGGRVAYQLLPLNPDGGMAT